MGQDLGARPETDGVAAGHPRAVAGDVPPPDGRDPEDEAGGHRRAEDQPDRGQKHVVDGRAGVGERHPEPRQGSGEPEGDQQPPGSAVPARPATAEAGGELERPEQAVEAGPDDVHQHRHRGGEEPGVVRGDLRAAGEFRDPGGARQHRDEAEQDQTGGHQPRSRGGLHGVVLPSRHWCTSYTGRNGRVYAVHPSRTGGLATGGGGMTPQRDARRAALNRDRVLRAAVALADRTGIDALSMRSLAEQLGVVPMALYKHVANKEELLDGMVEVVVGEIDPPPPGVGWKDAVRQRILSARGSLLRHGWAAAVIQSRTHAPPAVLAHMDSLIGTFRAGGLSPDLNHHAMHALGIRMWGFTSEVFPTPQPPADPDARAAMFGEFAARYPHIVEMATAVSHDGGSAAGGGCDDQFEFEFALDLLLDGFQRLHQEGWTSARSGPSA